MEKYNTVDKKQVEQAVAQTVKYLSSWTRQQLKEILNQQANQKKPLIVKLGNNGYLVGNYALRKNSDSWSMIYRYDDQELLFSNHESAMFYAILQQTGKILLANQIFNQDQSVSRLQSKILMYKLRYQRSDKKKNQSHCDLYLSRYNQAQMQLQDIQFQLKKSLQMAKYYNLRIPS